MAIALMATGFASTPLIAPSAAAAPAAPQPPVVTRHSGIFNGQSIRYTATVEPIDVPDAHGKPSARIVSFAYTADEAANPATRPVIFAFNGGPITASLWLHIGITGPKRVAMPEDLAASPATYRLVDNSYSPLDAADIVCFDPASTGFSRVLPGTTPESYYSVAADGQQTTAFISACGWPSTTASLRPYISWVKATERCAPRRSPASSPSSRAPSCWPASFCWDRQ